MPPCMTAVFVPRESDRHRVDLPRGGLGRLTVILSGTKTYWSPDGAELLLEIVSMGCAVSIRRRVLKEYQQVTFKFAACLFLASFFHAQGNVSWLPVRPQAGSCGPWNRRRVKALPEK